MLFAAVYIVENESLSEICDGFVGERFFISFISVYYRYIDHIQRKRAEPVNQRAHTVEIVYATFKIFSAAFHKSESST